MPEVMLSSQTNTVSKSQRLQQERIARRLQAIRKAKKLTQDQLSQALGFNDRQTLAAIEAGERRLQPAELVKVAQILQVDVDTFTDPYRLVGEGSFNFRASGALLPEVLDAFEARAGRWIATYRELGRRAGEAPRVLSFKLDLTSDSSYEDAQEAAETLVQRWELGDIPAERLEAAITEHLGVLVLYVDAPPGISGAATHLPGLPTILVNRGEVAGRRYYDLAHELFHVLTWDAMPPQRVESQTIRPVKGKRIEQLAENFAASLLMPTHVIQTRVQTRGDRSWSAWFRETARVLRVSVKALGYRLMNLRLLAAVEIEAAWAALKATRRGDEMPDACPRLFSAAFVRRVHDAVEHGFLSLRRASSLLQLPPAEFAELCASYGVTLSYAAAPASEPA